MGELADDMVDGTMHQIREDVAHELQEFGARIVTEIDDQALRLRKMGLKGREAGFLTGQAMLCLYLGIMVEVMGKAELGGDSLLGISTKIIALIGELPNESDMN